MPWMTEVMSARSCLSTVVHTLVRVRVRVRCRGRARVRVRVRGGVRSKEGLGSESG